MFLLCWKWLKYYNRMLRFLGKWNVFFYRVSMTVKLGYVREKCALFIGKLGEWLKWVVRVGNSELVCPQKCVKNHTCWLMVGDVCSTIPLPPLCYAYMILLVRQLWSLHLLKLTWLVSKYGNLCFLTFSLLHMYPFVSFTWAFIWYL